VELHIAIQLIERGVISGVTHQKWCDLGAGSGLFTEALATLLPSGSEIIAIDKTAPSIGAFLPTPPGIRIEMQQADFTTINYPPRQLDGALMANSLHFVRDKEVFLLKLMEGLKATGRLLLVEYDTDTPNAWVPYPISFASLNTLLKKTGMKEAVKLAHTNSRLQKGGIYCALIL